MAIWKRHDKKRRVSRLELESLEPRVLLSTTYIVDSLLDGAPAADGNLTLREAIQAANSDAIVGDAAAGDGADTITFAAGLAGGTINLSQIDDTSLLASALAVTSDITIDGIGAPFLTIGQDGTGGDKRLFIVGGSGDLTLRNITLSGGVAQGGNGASSSSGGGGGGGAGLGGGILVDGGTLTIVNSTFTNNQALGGSGGNSTTGSRANGGAGGGPNGGSGGTGQGGAGTAGGFGGGGGGSAASEVNLPADGSAGGFGGGGGGGGAHISVDQGVDAQGGLGGFGGGAGAAGDRGGVSFEIGGGGGGGAGLGGAIFANEGTVTITNSTFYNNTASGGLGGAGAHPAGDGQGLGGAIFQRGGTATLVNSTLDSNTADDGGAVFVVSDTVGGAGTVLQNSILSNSVATRDFGVQVVAPSTSVMVGGVANLIESGPGVVVSTADPVLGPLADNGGPTLTMAITSASPAYNAGNDGVAPSTDQRGFVRPVGQTDIGAFEVQTADLEVALSDSPGFLYAGQTLTYTITLTNNGPSTAAAISVVHDLPADFTFDPDNSDGTLSEGTGPGGVDQVLFSPADIPNGGTTTLTVTGEVNSWAVVTEADGQKDISSTVTVTSEGDPDLANNTDTETTNVGELAELVLTAFVDREEVGTGEQNTLYVYLHNNGPSAARDWEIYPYLNTSFGGSTVRPNGCSISIGGEGSPVPLVDEFDCEFTALAPGVHLLGTFGGTYQGTDGFDNQGDPVFGTSFVTINMQVPEFFFGPNDFQADVDFMVTVSTETPLTPVSVISASTGYAVLPELSNIYIEDVDANTRPPHGNLVIHDVSPEGRNDNLAVWYDSNTNEYVIQDPDNTLSLAGNVIDGGNGSGGGSNEVRVDAGLVTGKIIIDTGIGDDRVVLDHASGLLPDVELDAGPGIDTLDTNDAGNPVALEPGPETDSGILHVGATHESFFDNVESLLLVGAAIPPGLVIDLFEPNNSIAEATVLGSEQAITLRDLTIHDANDADYFQITAPLTGALSINAFFTHADGDINIRAEDSAGNTILESASATDNEHLVIPVVSQEMYFLRVEGAPGAVNTYDLEIENFAAPVPAFVDLAVVSDTGSSSTDNVTADNTPTILVRADLSSFAALNIPLDAAPGAEVQVVFTSVVSGFPAVAYADLASGVNPTLWSVTTPVLLDGEYYVEARLEIVDGQIPPAVGHTLLSEPLLLTIDTAAPAPTIPDLLASSDTGVADDDNVTGLDQPAFAGMTEPGARVSVLANGIVVGQGVAGTTGGWEITVEPLDDGAYDITTTAEDAAGNITAPSAPLAIWIDTQAPNVPNLDLDPSSDDGWHDDDNVTSIGNPLVNLTLNDTLDGGPNPFPNDIQARIYDRPGDLGLNGERLLYDSFAELGDLTPDGFLQRTLSQALNDPNGPPLAEGVHELKLVAEDRAGNISESFLVLTIDANAWDLSVARLANGQVILYDMDAPSRAESDVDQFDVRIHVDSNNVVTGVDILGDRYGGNPTGLGILIKPWGGGSVRVRDLRDLPPEMREDLAFIAIDGSASLVRTKMRIAGWENLGELILEPEGVVVDPDLDGDGNDDEATAFFSTGVVKKFVNSFGVQGDVVVRSADAQGRSIVRMEVRRGAVEHQAEVMTPDGGIGYFHAGQGNFAGRMMTAGNVGTFLLKNGSVLTGVVDIGGSLNSGRLRSGADGGVFIVAGDAGRFTNSVMFNNSRLVVAGRLAEGNFYGAVSGLPGSGVSLGDTGRTTFHGDVSTDTVITSHLTGRVKFRRPTTGAVTVAGDLTGKLMGLGFADAEILGDFLGRIGGKNTANGAGTLTLHVGQTLSGLVMRKPGGPVLVTGPDPAFNGAFTDIVVV